MATPKFSFDFLTSVPEIKPTEVMKTAASTPSVPDFSKPDLLSAIFPKFKESAVGRGIEAGVSGKGIKESIKEFGRGAKETFQRPLSADEMKEQATMAAIGFIQPLKVVGGEQIIKNYSAKISTEFAPKVKTIGAKLSDFYTSVVDRFNPIVNLAKKAGDIKPIDNPEILARNYLGIKSRAEVNLFKFTHTLDESGNVVSTGKSLKDVIEPVKNSLDDFRTFVTAQRDLELKQRGIRGVTDTGEESVAVIKALKEKYGETFSAFENSAKELREYMDRVALKPLVDIGAMTQETYDAIKKSNEFYVPFQRVLGELEETGFIGSAKNIFQPKVSPIKRIAGSEKQIIDPLESIIANTYKITDFVERARVAKSIVNLRNFSEELAGLIVKQKPTIIPVAKVVGEEGEKVIFRPNFFTPQENTMMVFEKGKRVLYKVPEDVYKAVTNMNSSDVTVLMKYLAWPLTAPTKLLRAGATLSPEFIARNPIRDQFTAFMNSKFGYKPFIDLVQGTFNVLGNTKLYQKWLAAGGDQAMFVSLDRLSKQKTLYEIVKSDSVTRKALNIVTHPIEALRQLSAFGEKGTRLGEFRLAIKKGVPDIEAAFASREVTLDFARIGQNTRAVNQIVAFWNANVQDIDKIARSFKERPVEMSIKAITGITLPTITLWMLNKDNPRYKELPQWRKDMAWNIIVSDDFPIISIPRPFTYGALFAATPEHILQWINDNEPDQLTSALKNIFNVASPGIIPTAALPLLENTTNYDFFRDRPIIGQSIQNLPPEMQSLNYTSESAKLVGRFIKYSPAKIENVVTGYSGGLGGHLLDIADKTLIKFGIVSPPPEPESVLSDIPVLKAFIAREPMGSGSESVNNFFEILEKSRQSKNGLKKLIEQGVSESEQIKYIQSHKELVYNKGFEKASRAMTEIFKKRNVVIQSVQLNPKQKKAVLQALDLTLTELAQQMLELTKESQ